MRFLFGRVLRSSKSVIPKKFIPSYVPQLVRSVWTSSEEADYQSDREEVIKHARTILEQKVNLLNQLSSEDYRQKVNQSSSIGAHMRHSLDHFNSIMGGGKGGDVVDYDKRNRLSVIETSRKAAIANCESLMDNLDKIEYSEGVRVKFLRDPVSGSSYVLSSNMGREIAFVTHHAVHHLSSIVNIMKILEYDVVGTNIGVASSTQQADINKK